MRALAILTLTLALPSTASAYTLHTAFTNACHEPITLDALSRANELVVTPESGDDAPWRSMADHLARTLERPEPTTDAEALRLTSAVLGVREPDLGRNGPGDVSDLRHIHEAEDLQNEHFLRRSDHDGPEGLAEAAEAARTRLLEILEESAMAYARDPDGGALVRVEVWVQYYRTVEIEVWEPLFHLARALHLLQDSFTHAYRSDDLFTVLTIQNYVEALEEELDRDVDGPPHSNALDDCTNPDGAEVVEAATVASAALVDATLLYWQSGDRGEVDAFVSAWMSLEPGCAAMPCTSRWVAVAQTDETGVTGCAVRAPGSGSSAWPLVVLWLWRRRARRP